MSPTSRNKALPPENIIRAIRFQFRYIRYSQEAHVLIILAGLFALCSSALLSLTTLSQTGFGT
jgi:hypothetical protein